MKKQHILFSFFFLLSFVNTISSQFVKYKDDSGWNLGFNIGGTWQENEPYLINNDTSLTQPFTTIRGGFTFGKAIYEKEGKFFSFDLRFRYLRGINYGWVHVRDSVVVPTSFLSTEKVEVFKNYKMDLREYTLEGVLTLNKLREETGFLLYGFGGIGFVDYRIRADYLNGSAPYNYSSLENYTNERKTAREIKKISDLDFETSIQGTQVRFMPSLGLGIGYQFTPHFSMGLEHKITYALSNDINNSGIEYDNRNDRYHYTAIKMNFDLFKGKGKANIHTTNNEEEHTVYTNKEEQQKSH